MAIVIPRAVDDHSLFPTLTVDANEVSPFFLGCGGLKREIAR